MVGWGSIAAPSCEAGVAQGRRPGRRGLTLAARLSSSRRACSSLVCLLGVLIVAAGRRCLPSAVVLPSDGAHELVVVRHGETDWNRALRVQGSTDIPLNDKGRTQADACARALARDYPSLRSPGVVYASRLQRAVVTATAIATALAATLGVAASTALGSQRATAQRSVEVCSDARLNEWDLGVLEGLKKDEAAARHAEDWATFSRWCSARVSPESAARPVTDGECMDDVRQRAVACLEEACKAALGAGEGESRQPVIAVTHGGVLGQLLRHAEESRGGAADVVQPAVNACISRFLVIPGGRWRILSWAETDHLSGEAAPVAADYDAAGEECPVGESG